MRAIGVTILLALLLSAVAAAEPRSAQPKVPASLIPLPPVRQATEYTCGPAALQSVLAYFGKAAQGEKALARQARANHVWGTTERDLRRLALRQGLKVRMQYDLSLAELKRRVRSGLPVIVGLQAWPTNPKRFDPENSNDGHYAVVIGFDRSRVWFMDPAASLGRRGWLKTGDFLKRWHWPDGRGRERRHFAMTLESPKRLRIPTVVTAAEEIE
jgi:predicted double-glycine peptidase